MIEHPDYWLGRILTHNGSRFRIYSYLPGRGVRLEEVRSGTTSYELLGKVEWPLEVVTEAVLSGKVGLE